MRRKCILYAYRPVVVEMSHHKGELLYADNIPAALVVQHVVVCGCHCALSGRLRYKVKLSSASTKKAN